jgi:hypothetical protein
MKFTSKTWLAILAGALLASPAAIASDHTDGSAVQVDEAADITDLYSWMSDPETLTMIMDVNKSATTATLFSNAVQYVFHTTAHGNLAAGGLPTLPVLLGGSSDTEIDVTCTFGATAPQTVQCWVISGTTVLDYVTGTPDMSTTSGGLQSASGNLTVWAGLASDPFFFNLEGFQETAGSVAAAAPSLIAGMAFDLAGCPTLPGPTVTALDGELTSADGGTPVDNFAGLNVLGIVVQLDLSSLVLANSALDTSGNQTDTLVSVWASTNSATN